MIYTFTKTPVAVDSLSVEISNSAITIALDYITQNGDDISIFFKGALSESEITLLGSIVSSHAGIPLESSKIISVNLEVPKTTKGIQKVAIYEPEGSASTIVTHDFADKCSWYQGSVEVIGEVLSTVDNLTYSSIKTHWIDLEHGRHYGEDFVMESTNNKYKVQVFVDAILVITGFAINYVTGKVIFDTAQTGIVTVNYHYADKSWYRIIPDAGKILYINVAEVQFSKNTTLVSSGPFVFEPWFNNHPLYGTMPIPGQKVVYKNAKDFISACNEGQGLVPAWGGELTQDVHVFPFNYARPKPLNSNDCIEIRVYCKNHEPVTGEFATATFYVTVENA